jgi:NAD(P)H-flavin reductase
MRSHNFIPKEAKIIEKKLLSPDVVSFKLKLKNFSFIPGQFVLASVNGFGEAPIGISSTPNKNSEFEIAIRAAGMVTKKLCSLGVGDVIGINGPLGNGFPLSRLKGRDVIIIGGGIGITPLRSLVQYIGDNKKFVKSLTILAGARSPESLLYQDEFKIWEKFARVEKTVDTPDKGWTGCVGILPCLYDRVKIKAGSVIIVCTPPVAHKSIVSRFAGKSVADKDLYFMLERNMKCGIGKCQHCTCGKFYTCLDGPVFSYEQLKYNPEAF